ncbi:hypothetical protein GCM10027422_08690 [Hymenobacter arcticus]
MLLSGLVGACHKKNDDPVAPTKAQLLTGVKWREIGHSKNPLRVGNKAGGNLYDLYPACQYDNYVVFSTANLMTVDEGATKCAAAGAQSWTAPWYFQTGESQLIISLPSASLAPQAQAYTFDIVELSASTLALRRTEQDLQGQTVEELTFTAF